MDSVIIAGGQIDGREAATPEASCPVGTRHQVLQRIIQSLGLEETAILDSTKLAQAAIRGAGQGMGFLGSGRTPGLRERVKKALKLE